MGDEDPKGAVPTRDGRLVGLSATLADFCEVGGEIPYDSTCGVLWAFSDLVCSAVRVGIATCWPALMGTCLWWSVSTCGDAGLLGQSWDR